jgi:hypothetical protein
MSFTGFHQDRRDSECHLQEIWFTCSWNERVGERESATNPPLSIASGRCRWFAPQSAKGIAP